jgi:hypothetical protein
VRRRPAEPMLELRLDEREHDDARHDVEARCESG